MGKNLTQFTRPEKTTLPMLAEFIETVTIPCFLD